jgi:transposase-like protein
VRLVLEEHLTYAAVATRLEIRKAERIEVWVRKYREEAEERELERLRMENALLKKFHTELRKVRLAQRNIGRSTTTRKNTK